MGNTTLSSRTKKDDQQDNRTGINTTTGIIATPTTGFITTTDPRGDIASPSTGTTFAAVLPTDIDSVSGTIDPTGDIAPTSLLPTDIASSTGSDVSASSTAVIPSHSSWDTSMDLSYI